MSIKKYNSRKWLNPKTTAYIYSILESDDSYIYGSLKMGDCNKIVQFDIDVSNKKDRVATLKKLNIMVDELQGFIKAIGDIDGTS